MSNPPDPSLAARRRPACPVCSRPATSEQTPFCSQGCRDRDLLQWLGEGYRVAGPTVDTDPEE